MELYPVEAGLFCVLRGLAVLIDDPLDLVSTQGSRRLKGLHPRKCEDLAGWLQSRRRYGERPSRLQGGMRNPPDMP
ncbi:hypothetical protein V1283_005576 [Bradyrhizobium sp. AZCC 2262]